MTRAEAINKLAALTRALRVSGQEVIDHDGRVLSSNVGVSARGGESFVLRVQVVKSANQEEEDQS